MPDYEKIPAEPRTIVGKEVKRLRRQGLLPGVIYGPAVDEPLVISLDARTFENIYQRVGSSQLVDVAVGDMSRAVFIRHVARDPLKHTLVHTELYAPNLNKVTEVTVAIVTFGEPSDRGQGVLTHGRADVTVRGLPANIPQSFEVDLSRLQNIDDAILVSDLEVPEGVEILTPGDEVIVRLSAAQRAAEEGVEEAEVEEAAEETAEVEESPDESE
jgi:large subunit ribosomal protein L25